MFLLTSSLLSLSFHLSLSSLYFQFILASASAAKAILGAVGFVPGKLLRGRERERESMCVRQTERERYREREIV